MSPLKQRLVSRTFKLIRLRLQRHFPTVLREPGTGLKASIRIRTFDEETCRQRFPRWDRIPRDGKATILDYAHRNGSIGTGRDTTDTNATTYAMHTYIAALLSAQTADQAGRVLEPPSKILLGNNFGSGSTPDPSLFQPSDTGLNNQVGEVQLSDPVGFDREWTAQELIGSLELDDEILREWAVATESDEIWNHGPITPELERAGEANVLLDISIPIRDVSEV